MIKEKREDKRFQIELPIVGRLLRKDRKVKLTQEIPVVTKDISLGGLRLNWPKVWKCDECKNCLGWVFNFGCRFKEDNSNRINRILDEEVVFEVVLKVKDDKHHKVAAKIIWIEKPKTETSHYDVGLNFIKLSRELEEGIISLMKKD